MSIPFWPKLVILWATNQFSMTDDRIQLPYLKLFLVGLSLWWGKNTPSQNM